MKESLQLLIQLQQIDAQLMDIEAQKGDLPELVEHLTRELQNLEQSITAKTSRLAEIEQEKRQLQATLEDTRERLKKYQDQLLLVATNRAYDALTSEIDVAKNSLDGGEFHLLELNDEQQRLTDELKADELKSEEKRTELSKQKKSLEVAISDTEEHGITLEKGREEILSHIDPRFLRAYERIRAARDGIAVVPMSRGACGVCYNRIPPQQQVEIKAMDKIVTCESCGVMLFWKED